MKILQYVRLYIKIVSHRLRIITPSTPWDMRTLDLRNVCLQTYRNNRMSQKVTYFLRKIQTLPVNNSGILRIQNAKFSGYHFYMNTNIWRDFQIWISVPLISSLEELVKLFCSNYWQKPQVTARLPEVFCKQGVLKTIVKFTGKQLCWSLFLIKSHVLKIVYLWILQNV